MPDSKMLTQREALDLILNHYGAQKQELQAVQELSELILLLAARPDQRGQNYKKRITEEIADCSIMLEQVKMMHEINDYDITEVVVHKLERQLDRIDKELHDG